MWYRVITGICIVVTGLIVELAMVIGAVTPSLALALAGYAALFIGMLAALAGILRLFRSDRQAAPAELEDASRPEANACWSRHHD